MAKRQKQRKPKSNEVIPLEKVPRIRIESIIYPKTKTKTVKYRDKKTGRFSTENKFEREVFRNRQFNIAVRQIHKESGKGTIVTKKRFIEKLKSVYSDNEANTDWKYYEKMNDRKQFEKEKFKIDKKSGEPYKAKKKYATLGNIRYIAEMEKELRRQRDNAGRDSKVGKEYEKQRKYWRQLRYLITKLYGGYAI